MKLLTLYLVMVSFWYSDGFLFDWSKLTPGRRNEDKEPKVGFQKRIELRLVKKDWMPVGPNLPEGSEVSPRYTGSTEEAFDILIDAINMYEYNDRPLENGRELLTEENGYKSELESIFIFGTLSDTADNIFTKNMMTVFALRNIVRRYNVFTFNVLGSFWNLDKIIGDFLNSVIRKDLIKIDQIHFFGFCYSSQLSGYIARYISSKNNKQKIKSITALDPYSIVLSSFRHRVLSKNDAQIVYAYHTNSMVFGTLYRRATADFSFNSGLFQPGCYTAAWSWCSHARAVTAFWFVILYPDLFQARKCPHWLLFKSCLCNKNEVVPLTFPPSPGAKGKYFFNTMSHKPYGYGGPGANCYTEVDENIKYIRIMSNNNQAHTTTALAKDGQL